MKATQSFKALGAAAALAAMVLAGMLSSSTRLQAQNNQQNNQWESMIQQGFAIAPVPLDTFGGNGDLIGLGSYLVNAIGDCNTCHTSGEPPLYAYPFALGGNPYFGQPEKLDPTIYMNGGANFGPVGTPTGPLMYAGPDIITRNLTPNFAGLPEGGHTLSQFKQIMRTGIDFDHIHPTCTAAQLAVINAPNVTAAELPNCIPTSTTPPNTVDGNLLQVMPWVTFSHLTDHDLDAIYAYLSAIPCINNTTSTPPAGAPNELLNNCGTAAPEARANDQDKDSGVPKGTRSRRLH